MKFLSSPPPPARFLRPLDVIRAEHDHQVRISGWLRELAGRRQLAPLRPDRAELIGYLTENLPLHYRDEEDDLFRLLRLRCRPPDGIEWILTELGRDHAAESFLMRDIVVDLTGMRGGKTPESPARLFASLQCFAEGQVRHLTWENRVVLPLARVRLSPADLEEMGRNMAARRGAAYPG